MRRRRTGHSTWARPTGFAVDSPLEGAVFESSVPLCGVVVSGWNRNAGIGEEDDSKALSAAGTERSNPACSTGESVANLPPWSRTIRGR